MTYNLLTICLLFKDNKMSLDNVASVSSMSRQFPWGAVPATLIAITDTSLEDLGHCGRGVGVKVGRGVLTGSMPK